MKAIVQHGYGSTDALALEDVPVPTPGEGEVLVRVHAASLHADIWHAVTGRPYVMRLMGPGLRQPKIAIPGIDLAGRVDSVGSGVTTFAAGDEVFGECVRGIQWKNGGAFAEFACVLARDLAPKPTRLSFEQAAAVPTSGLIAGTSRAGRGTRRARAERPGQWGRRGGGQLRGADRQGLGRHGHGGRQR